MTTPWVAFRTKSRNSNFRLFCLHHAGGSSAVFRSWGDPLTLSAEICGVELPGRGTRLNETPISRLDDLLPQIARALQPLLDRPYAIFGHSLGALIGFELSRFLQTVYGVKPQLLFVAGRSAPHLVERDLPGSDSSASEILAYLRRMEGTPEEILADPEAMELALPPLRADLEIIRRYRFGPGPALQCPIYAWGGLLDSGVTKSALHAWKEVTTEPCNVAMFDGGHFFIVDAREQVLESVRWAIQLHCSPQ
jgi:medium-chain acyl-[acyl-carrier-protein] hydrolase